MSTSLNRDEDDADTGTKTVINEEEQLELVRKVLGILSGQLIVVFVIVLASVVSSGASLWELCGSPTGFTALDCVFVAMLAMLGCSIRARQTSPYNYILLTLFTITMSYMCAGADELIGNDGWGWYFGSFMISACWLFGAVKLAPTKDKLRLYCLAACGCAVVVQACICIPLLYTG